MSVSSVAFSLTPYLKKTAELTSKVCLMSDMLAMLEYMGFLVENSLGFIFSLLIAVGFVGIVVSHRDPKRGICSGFESLMI